MQALAGVHRQRLHFPFLLSAAHCSSPEGRARVAALGPALACPILERWAAALHDLTYPPQRWQAWVAALDRLLSDGRQVCVWLAQLLRNHV